MIVGLSGLSRAAEYLVVNKNESGVGSLQWAILEANNNPGMDEILFNISDTLDLTTSYDTNGYLPSIEDSVEIYGNEVVLKGIGTHRFIEINAYTYIEDLSFFRGYNARIGGALKINEVNVFLENCGFANNQAEGSILEGLPHMGWGGAISISNGQLTISSCFFISNSGRTRGGAVYADLSASVVIVDSAFMFNNLEGNDQTIYAIDNSSISINSIVINHNSVSQYADIILGNNSSMTFTEGFEINNDNMFEVDIE